VPEQAQRKHRDQGVTPEAIIGICQHVRMQTDFGHLMRLRAAKDVCVYIADTCNLKLRHAAFDLHASIYQCIDAINFVARDFYGEIIG